MGLLDKVKNLFTEEVEIEETEEIRKPKPKPKKKKEEEPIQKEVIKVEIPSPKETRSSHLSRFEEEDIIEKEETIEEKQPPKEEYKFPFFDDDDFDTIEVKREKKEEKKEYRKEIYNPPKEERKIFKPSPIISPVFGFMDKDYSKEEIINRNKSYSAKKATVDEIRDKAFGSLESDIESTLFGTGRVIFDEDSKQVDDIIEENSLDEKEEYNSQIISEKPRHENMSDEDLTDLLEAEMAKPESKKTKSKKPRKISDKELFNLIDSMYEGEKK